LGHQKLTETYAQVLREAGNNSATRLIDLSIKLDNGGVPETEIQELGKRFRKNNFGFSVLRDMVANYLYLFPVEQSTKQRLGQLVDINTSGPGMMIGRDKKMLTAPKK